MSFSTLTAVLNLDSSGFRSGVQDAEKDLGQLQDRAVSAGRSMQRAGGMMTAGITAPLTAMGVMSVRTAASFDQAMQESIAVMGDVDDAMREDLEATAREVAKNTTHSASEAAESFYFLASAGLDATEAMEAMPQVAAFAEAGQMNMAEATDVATNVMSAYGIEAEDMSKVTDTMTATVQNHNQTMEGMSAAFKNAAPAAASMGVELEELAALTGALGDVGIQGAEAGTALNSIMRRFAKDGGEAARVLEEVGVETTDANGDLRSMTAIFGDLEDANLTAAQTSALFGQQMSAGNALLSAGQDDLEAYQERLGDAEGATSEMAETQRETLNAEMQMARSNLEDVGIAIGSDLLPMLSTLTGYLTAGAERFQNLSDRQRKVAIAAGVVLAVGGPLLLMLGTFLTMLPMVVSGWATLAAAKATLAGIITGGLVPALVATNVALGPITVPIWAIIAAIGALVGAVGLLWYAWDNNVLGIRDTTVDAFEDVKAWLDAAPKWVLALIGPIGWLYAAWRENLFGVQDIVGTVFDWIGQKIGWLRDQIDRIPGIGEDEIAPDNDEVAAAGATTGADYAEEFEENASPTISPEIETGSQEEIKGEMTPAMRQALEDGVAGYVSDPDKIEDVPTAINEDLFEAMEQTDGGATAKRLGISEAEFQTLIDRFAGAGPGPASGPPSSASTAGGTNVPDGSPGNSGTDIAAAIRDALEGMVLTVDGDIETDEGHTVQIVEGVLSGKSDRAGRMQ